MGTESLKSEGININQSLLGFKQHVGLSLFILNATSPSSGQTVNLQLAPNALCRY